MYLRSIRVACFRNLQDAQFEFGPRINMIYGANAQGKTNLLEAVHLAVQLRPFRAQRNEDMISFAADEARVRGGLCSDFRSDEVEIEIQPGQRRIRLNGKALSSSAARPSELAALLFTTDDLAAPKGSPSQRRRMLDQAVELAWPGYGPLVRGYNKTLRQRNLVLKEQGPDHSVLLDSYDTQLSTMGGRMVVARMRYLKAIDDDFVEVLGKISGTTDQAKIVYLPNAVELSDDAAAASTNLLETLQRTRAEQLRAGRTTAGPHTDDLDFLIADKSARQFASQGQIRSLILAFKFSQLRGLERQTGSVPLLLLDDVSSELDPVRNQFLFERVEETSCQVFLTTARPELIPALPSMRSYAVEHGKVYLRT